MESEIYIASSSRICQSFKFSAGREKAPLYDLNVAATMPNWSNLEWWPTLWDFTNHFLSEDVKSI